MNRNVSLRSIQPKGKPAPSNRRSNQRDISPKLEREWFAYDRSAVLRQIDLVQSSIDANANDLGMVAAEGVFEKPLSDELLRTSRSLLAMGQDLCALRSLVAQTDGYPKDESIHRQQA